MKTTSLSLLFICLCSFVQAQDFNMRSTRTSVYDPTLAKEIHKVSLFPLGYAYERRINEEFTFQTGIDFSLDSYFEDYDETDNYALIVNPTIHFEPRYYYNMERRYKRGRNVNFNAASYLGIYAEYTFNPLVDEYHDYHPTLDRFKIGPAWGLQRNLGRRGYLNFNLAYGLRIDQDNHAEAAWFARLTIGLRLNGIVEKHK